MSITIICPYCGKEALAGSCGNFWCPYCKNGHWKQNTKGKNKHKGKIALDQIAQEIEEF